MPAGVGCQVIEREFTCVYFKETTQANINAYNEFTIPLRSSDNIATTLYVKHVLETTS